MEHSRKWFVGWAIGIVTAIVLFSLAALTMGRYEITLGQIWSVFFPKAGQEVSGTVENVVLNVRLPRIGLALLAGAGLSSAGGAFQALFANPLATPDTLGVATGASFGAVLAILFGWPSMAIQTSALAAGLLAVALVYMVSRPKKGGGRASVVMIVLAGMVVGSLFSALVSLVKYAADPQDVLPTITFWLMGSLSSTTKETLVLGAPFILAGMALLFLFRWKLNAMTLSEEEAISLGISVKKIRAVVVLAALINGAKCLGLELPQVQTVISGAGAAGISICKLLMKAGVRDITLCDRQGAIWEGREGLNGAKTAMAKVTNRAMRKGSLAEVMEGADLFIGVSGPGIVTQEMVRSMSPQAMVFALSNPVPEIMPELALAAGAKVVATGRSDFPNQINNLLVFPGIFKGALAARASRITEEMMIAAAYAIAGRVSSEELSRECIIPSTFDMGVADVVAEAVKAHVEH